METTPKPGTDLSALPQEMWQGNTGGAHVTWRRLCPLSKAPWVYPDPELTAHFLGADKHSHLFPKMPFSQSLSPTGDSAWIPTDSTSHRTKPRTNFCDCFYLLCDMKGNSPALCLHSC